VLGIFGTVLVCIGGPLLFAIPAIICGHVAFGKINRSGGLLTGKGLAIAGFTAGYAGLGLMLLLLPIAIPNFIKGRNIAFKNACVNHLRQIDAAKQQWALEKQKERTDTPTAEELRPYLGKLPDEVLRCPSGGSYTIHAVGEAPACSVPDHKLP
jgi:hypothetical protein